MNAPLKNSNLLWNGCFSLPRKLNIENGRLIQRPIEALKQLRREHFRLAPRELPVTGPETKYTIVQGFHGDQLEIIVEFDLHNASFCGLNVLSDHRGAGGLSVVWSGDLLNVDGVMVTMNDWKPGRTLRLQIFVDKKFVEVFADDGKYCITRQVREENVNGTRIALTSLGGTARLVSFDAWRLGEIG
ncbi:MAG: hypothetical protein GF353_29525 [Candidatus Lokiarchaeota archaeon]|nr:hypothetical protein [Candidatus Lokiarchaeota archaeon]